MSSKVSLLKELPAFRALADYSEYPDPKRREALVDAACAEVEALVAERDELRAAMADVRQVVWHLEKAMTHLGLMLLANKGGDL